MSYVVDTNIFNKLVDGVFRIEDLPSDGPYLATHVQIDELNNTKDTERRARLFLMFAEVRPQVVPTESFVWDVSRWDHGKWGDGILYEKLKQDLDALNKSKANNARDILIAEVAIVNEYTLLTADRDLATVAKKHGGKVVYYET
jgi:rRNA-processing protein FCF1